MRCSVMVALLLGSCTGNTTDVPPSDTGQADTDTDSDTDTDADTDTDTDTGTGTGTGAGLLTGEGTAVVDASTWVGTESVSIVADSGYGDVSCTITYDLASVATRGDCAQCEWAFDLELSNATVTYDDGACAAALGVDASTVASWNGQTRSYGYVPNYFGHAEVLVSFDGASWSAQGYCHYDEASGDLTYSWTGDLYPY